MKPPPPPAVAPSSAPAAERLPVVLYEDASVLAVAKPAGLTVIPARDEPPEDSLRVLLERARGESLWVVHRIDRDTSGVVLFARDAASHRALSLAFERHAVRKTYVAFTRGALAPERDTIELALHPARKGKMRPALSPDEPGALASVTEYVVERTSSTAAGPVARVRVHPRTGRQHQIRVHLRARGAPLLVDALYGRAARLPHDALGPGSPALGRLALHALAVELGHPVTQAPLRIEAPLAPDLAALDAWLAG